MKNLLLILSFVIVSGLTLVGCSDLSGEPPAAKTDSESSEPVDRTELKDQPTAKPKEKTASSTKITVYKSPTCGCCTSWESHLEDNGFVVSSNSTDKMTEIRQRFNVPRSLSSCHTAIIDGYVIEGHVPAADIKKLLSERPELVGLAAPGMPKDSPGMQPKDEEPKGYDVLSFDKNGNTDVFTSY
ncbi:MAG: DUF411 domain-containing protein [Acidobacteria bacterium]|nr:MAG: DUF411 domain-containing protein [Acidobacteriota bacterium]REJ98275.1 MAG: DUF411 domain-containing protein [Acidobacteriota bacterium]REK17019.1 MAG: DUF411 domain-containing protein [Acidobacteriota bacterium]REK42929.1 MAG: DUF411 domain-containing protein [Acidobacteriota bacterium]